MKIYRFGLLVLTLLTLNQCKKKDVAPQLPAETTTGAMTFGCKIDGRVFVPRNYYTRTGLYVQYVYLGPGKGGGYFLNIPAINWAANPIEGISITTDSLLVQEGQTYSFRMDKGSAKAFYFADNEFHKLDQDDGHLTITRFDAQQGILSGRFDFVGTDTSTGRQVHVTDGRFDVRF